MDVRSGFPRQLTSLGSPTLTEISFIVELAAKRPNAQAQPMLQAVRWEPLGSESHIGGAGQLVWASARRACYTKRHAILNNKHASQQPCSRQERHVWRQRTTRGTRQTPEARLPAMT